MEKERRRRVYSGRTTSEPGDLYRWPTALLCLCTKGYPAMSWFGQGHPVASFSLLFFFSSLRRVIPLFSCFGSSVFIVGRDASFRRTSIPTDFQALQVCHTIVPRVRGEESEGQGASKAKRGEVMHSRRFRAFYFQQCIRKIIVDMLSGRISCVHIDAKRG